MAIKKTKEPSKPQLPPALDEMLLKGFTEQFMKDHYDKAFKETKEEVETYLETNTDGFNIEKGVGFKSDYGSVTYTGRENLSVDKDKLLELIEKGELTVAQVFASISTWKKDALQGTLAGHYADVVTINETEYLTFKASGEFKEKCASQMSMDGPVGKEVTEELKTIETHVDKKVTVKKTEPVSKAALAKKALAAKKNKKVDADDDLASILDEE
jgi:hypothetical protein